MGQKFDNGDSGLDVRTELNKLIPEVVAVFDPADIELTDKETYFDDYAQAGALVVTDPVNNYVLGSAFTVTITTDGNAITFPAGWKAIKNDYADDIGDYILTASFGTEWVYTFIKLT